MSRLDELYEKQKSCEIEINKELTKEKIAVMQAFVDGNSIEFCTLNDRNKHWLGIELPCWSWNIHNYRVKED